MGEAVEAAVSVKNPVDSTVKPTALLARPLAVTTTLPVVAPLGTGTTRLVSLQLVGVARVPLNVTVLFPCVAPKVVPVMVTEPPTTSAVGVMLVIAGITVKPTALLPTSPAVTTTFPVVAPAGTVTLILVELQLITFGYIGATVPLNAT